MTTDLLSSRVLEGKLRAEVRELLGEPDNITKAGNFEYKTDPGAWLHGANNGPWIHYLHVDFGGEQSRVERAYITD